MTTNSDQFVIAVKLETDKINQQMAEMQNKMNSFSGKVEDSLIKAFSGDSLQKQLTKSQDILKTSVNNMNKILTGGLMGLGSVLGVDFMMKFIDGATSRAHGLQAISQAYNTTPKKAQLLQEVYKRTGGSAEGASQAIGQLYTRLNSGQIDQGLGSVINQLGIKNAQNRDPAEVIIEMLRKIGSGGFTNVQRGSMVQRAGLGQEALALTNNPQLLNKYIKEVTPNLINNKSSNDLAELDRQFQDLGQRWEQIANTVTDKLLKPLKIITDIIENSLGMQTQDSTIKPKNFTVFNDFNKTIDNMLNDGSKIWDKVKSGIGFAETSGGNVKQKLKADAMGAYGTYGLRLSTAKDQLKFEGKQKEATSLTVDDLRANNYKKADEIAQKYYERLAKAYGQETAIKKFHGSLNQTENQEYLNKVLKHTAYSVQPLVAQNNTESTQHHTHYNVDNIHLHNVQNPKHFTDELSSLRNLAFSSSGNIKI